MKIVGSVFMSWLKSSFAKGNTLECDESESCLFNIVSTAPALTAGMDCWHSVRLQPELLGAGAFFDVGSDETQTNALSHIKLN